MIEKLRARQLVFDSDIVVHIHDGHRYFSDHRYGLVILVVREKRTQLVNDLLNVFIRHLERGPVNLLGLLRPRRFEERHVLLVIGEPKKDYTICLADRGLHVLQDFRLLDSLCVGLDAVRQLAEIHPAMDIAAVWHLLQCSDKAIGVDNVSLGNDFGGLLLGDTVKKLQCVPQKVLQAPVVVEVDERNVVEHAFNVRRLSARAEYLHEFDEPRFPNVYDI